MLMETSISDHFGSVYMAIQYIIAEASKLRYMNAHNGHELDSIDMTCSTTAMIVINWKGTLINSLRTFHLLTTKSEKMDGSIC
jgi:hypothetical protein